MVFYSSIVSAQISLGGIPYGFELKSNLKSLEPIPAYNLQILDKGIVLSEDSIHDTPLRYSIFEDANIDLKNGLKTKLNNGQLWRYKFRGIGSESLQIIFSKFIVPEGARLYIYDEKMKHFVGAFTEKNIQQDSTFVVADFSGDSLIVEYFEPDNCKFKGKVIIGSIGKAFLDIQSSKIQNLFIGINCPEGRDWQNQKHATCMITFKFAGFGYLCSGSLINNTNNDGTPYFLTASHCVHDSITAKTIVAYFNYDEMQCSSTIIPHKSLSGTSLLSTGPWSDYTLLKLDNTPPPDYQPYYAGWDRTGNVPKSTVCILHPLGHPKKIAFDYKPSIIIDDFLTWNNGTSSPAFSHWVTSFTNGTVREGSSGAPLFDENKRIIGQLHGSNYANQYYGIFRYSWNHNNPNYKPLKSFLDPDQTGLTKIDGYFPSTNIPDPQFYSDFPQVCISTPIELKNNSVFNSTFWKWKFSPDSVTYINNTDSASENPVVTFNKSGNYNIVLLSGNASGNDSIVADSSIIASNVLNVKVYSDIPDGLCLNEFDSLLFIAKGATVYNWNVSPSSDNYFYFSKLSNDSAIVKKFNSAVFDSTIDISVNVLGKNGICSGTDNGTYTLIKPSNDNLEFAKPILFGHNGPFTNHCAIAQNGEPTPPHLTCLSQDSWCDQFYPSNDLILHSVWFTLIAQTDPIFISTEGIDSRIALYDASSFTDLLNNNYVMLAANDDISTANLNSSLYSVHVAVGKQYWLQVDASRGRAGGSFFVNISDFTDIASTEVNRNIVSIYPQPFSSDFVVQNESFIGKNLNISVYSITGTIIYNTVRNNSFKSTIDINAAKWKNGLYIIRILADDKVYSAKILKE
jgi:hypothetical protein